MTVCNQFSGVHTTGDVGPETFWVVRHYRARILGPRLIRDL